MSGRVLGGAVVLAVLAGLPLPDRGEAMAEELPVVNGVRLIHEENEDLGMVSIEVVVEAGSIQDPPGREGLADMTAHMLLRGTKSRSYQEIMDEMNDLGASIEVVAQKEFMVVSGDFMPRYQDRYAALLADVLAHPTFPADEFEHERTLALEDIRNARNDDGELARHFFARFLYRGHPLGLPSRGYLATVGTLKPKDCRDFYRQHFRRGNVVVAVAGSIDRAGAEGLVRQVTAGLKRGGGARPELPPPPVVRGTHVLVVDKPERTQTQVIMGHPSLHWRDPDLFPLLIGNTAIGGTFTARLMNEIREKRGWSYGASSTLHVGRTMGTLSIGFFPANKDTLGSILVAQELFRDVVRDGLTDEEVAFAENHLANQFPFRLETARKRAGERLSDVLFDRPERYVQDYVANVRARKPSEVNAALKRWYHPDDMVIVVVGTASELLEDLKKIPGVAGIEVIPFDTDVFPAAPAAR
jgi:zinc protease